MEHQVFKVLVVVAEEVQVAPHLPTIMEALVVLVSS
jgi:hypothetical protein